MSTNTAGRLVGAVATAGLLVGGACSSESADPPATSTSISSLSQPAEDTTTSSPVELVEVTVSRRHHRAAAAPPPARRARDGPGRLRHRRRRVRRPRLHDVRRLTRTRFRANIIFNRVGWSGTLVTTIGLVWVILTVAVLYRSAISVTARITDREPTALADSFISSLIPIALGYAIAHYFSLLVFDAQNFYALLSDPFGRGWNLIGTYDFRVNYRAVSTRTIALVQVGAIVVGHVCGVVVAHDRAVALFPSRLAIRSQLPLLEVMVIYTVGGLLILLGG